MTPADLQLTLLVWAATVLLVGAVALRTRFLGWPPPPRSRKLSGLGGLLRGVVVAAWEEWLYRQQIQRLLVAGLGAPMGLLLALAIFTVAHWRPGEWRFALLAGLAGTFWVWLYHHTGSVGASALAHCLLIGPWLGVWGPPRFRTSRSPRPSRRWWE
ncbi:MAG: CPBP family intramembrane metalloprotease [Armatimonadetes bacterium]|nr:CPBP family intramembrane metalloprotease [Armatimonadota bacterium]